MTQKVLRGEAVPSRAKTQQSIGRKSFYSDTSYGLEYVKTGSVNYLLKCSKKNQSSKGLCLPNASEFYNVGNLTIFFNFTPTTVSIGKQP